MPTAVDRHQRAMKMITECHNALLRSGDETTLLNELCRIIVERGGYRMAWVGFPLHDDAKSVQPVAQYGFQADYLESITLSWGDNELSLGPTGTAIRLEKPHVCRNIATDPRFDIWRAEAEKRGFSSNAAFPLIVGDLVIGALSVYSPIPDAFDDVEVSMLADMASNIAFGVNSLRVRRERDQMEGQLKDSYAMLESRVEKRTEELSNANTHLTLECHERQRVEDALRESETQWQNTFDSISDFVSIHDSSYTLLKVNKSLADFLGMPRKDIVGRRCYELLHGKDSPWNNCPHSATLKTGTPSVEEVLDPKLGIDLLVTTSPIFDKEGRVTGSVHIAKNITRRKQIENELVKSLKEKEVLIKEVYHRVKNNLQVVSSLLQIQAGFIKDDFHREMFRESQNRIKSMAFVHQLLYQSKDLTRVDLKTYLDHLAPSVYNSYADAVGRINLQVEVENVYLDTDTAMHCGLIVNELLTNSLKYAFPERRSGNIHIHVKETDGFVELLFGDDGQGLPEGLDVRNNGSLGLQLVFALSESQLRGKVKVEAGKNGGTVFKITFPLDKPNGGATTASNGGATTASNGGATTASKGGATSRVSGGVTTRVDGGATDSSTPDTGLIRD
jgi:PAS domain S-box-containing protein